MRRCSRCKTDILVPYEEWKGHMCKECRSANSKDYNMRRYESNPYKGFVYIISNPAWDGWLKIGRAIKLDGRLSSYQTSSPFRDYKIEYSAKVSNPLIIERELFELYGTDNNEWFKLDLSEAIEFIKRYEG